MERVGEWKIDNKGSEHQINFFTAGTIAKLMKSRERGKGPRYSASCPLSPCLADAGVEHKTDNAEYNSALTKKKHKVYL